MEVENAKILMDLEGPLHFNIFYESVYISVFNSFIILIHSTPECFLHVKHNIALR